MNDRVKILFLTLLIAATTVEYYLIAQSIIKKKVNVLPEVYRLIKKTGFSFQKSHLKETVEQALSGAKGEYRIVIKHLQTGESFVLREHEKFQTGSLYKLWVMATVFEQVEKGFLKESDVLSQDIQVLNEKFWISTEAAELKEGHIEMTVSQALDQMITISHNYAALLLSERLRNFRIREFLKNHNFDESFMGATNEPPQATASDIAHFLERVYKEELVDNKYSQKMMELLKRQQLNDGIPKYLPKDVVVAHKTGEIGWFKHDAGIVFSKNGDYIIVVLSESNFPLGAQERIAQISRAVYHYFNP